MFNSEVAVSLSLKEICYSSCLVTVYDSENEQPLRTDEKPAPELGRPLGPTPNQSREEPEEEEETEEPQANTETGSRAEDAEHDGVEEVDRDSSNATYDV